MKNRYKMLGLTASVTLTLCLGSAQATTFDAGQALKATMAQGTPSNPYTDANDGVWTFGKTTAVAGGTLVTLDKTDQNWGATIKGFSDLSALPTINVNVGDVPVLCENGLADGSHTIDPGEIVLHPENGDVVSRYAIIRFVVPMADVFHISATFRDASSGPSEQFNAGVEVYVVVNGQTLSSALVSSDATAVAGSLPAFTASVRSMPLAVGDIVDFVVGPNGSYFNDGTALQATITTQAPGEFDLINLDINGYTPGDDPVPGTDNTYSGAARVGTEGDYWNPMAITETTFTNRTAPSLKLSDGITHSTVRFNLSKEGGGILNADRYPPPETNALLDDYVYIADGSDYRFTLTGLVPGSTNNLYFYCQAHTDYNPCQFEINGKIYESTNKWFPASTTADYAACLDVTADSNGSITGLFRKTASGLAAVLNGLQIVGSFPRSHAEIVNLDINGYYPDSGDLMPVASDTYAGAARVGNAGDFWNHVDVANFTVTGIIAPSLKLSDGLTNSAVCFTMMAGKGGTLGADRMPTNNSVNALLDDCVYINSNSQPTNSFTISGLEPYAAYDLYFYCRGGTLYFPGRFIINDVAYDSIDQAFPADGGADYALCAGITADSGGMITGDFCQVGSRDLAATFDGLQIAGTFPRQHAEIVNLDINGYKPDRHSEPGAADFFSGAAVIGAAGDFWNQTSVPYEALTGFTTRHLKLTDGQSNSTVTFSLSADSGGLLKADRIAIGSSVNKLLGDYIFINHDEAYSHPFTISGLAPNTPYDLYFYSAAGIYNTPGRFTINSVGYDSVYACFSANHGDLAACTGIMADSNGVITGAFSRGSSGDATLNGVQISGKIPRLALGTVLMLQ